MLVLGLLSIVGAGMYSQNLDTIAGKVTAAGIPLGGMDKDEAVAELNSNGYDAKADDSVSVVMNEHIGIEISLKDAGLFLPAEEAAEAAFNYGKDGNIFSNGIAFISSIFGGADVITGNMDNFDEERVRDLISVKVREANESALESAYIIEEDAMLITKGVSDVLVNENDIYDLVYKAFKSNNLGAVDYSPSGSSNSPKLDLEEVYEALHGEMQNAEYDKENETIKPSVTGIEFDPKEAQAIYDKAAEGETVRIPITVTLPEVSTEQLEECLFRDTLSSKSTSLSSSSGNRLKNVTLAAAAINGTVLNPGEEFSFNGTVGERTTAKGYKPAGAYVNGESVDQVGGGICQVSSTIYYCVLHADLEVTDRRNHMFTVSYLPLGMDATVNWGSLDFKFKNDTKYPVKIVSYVEGRTLYVKLVGTKETGDYVKVQYVVVGSVANKTIEKSDPTLEPGTTKVETAGHPGTIVDTYRYLYDSNGNLISKTYITRSTYRGKDRVVLIGPPAVEVPDPGIGGETTDPGAGGGTTDPGTGGGTVDPGTGGGTTDPGTGGGTTAPAA